MIEHSNGRWIVTVERFKEIALTDEGWGYVRTEKRFVGGTKGEVATVIAEEISSQTALEINLPEEAEATAHNKKKLYDCLEDLVDFPA